MLLVSWIMYIACFVVSVVAPDKVSKFVLPRLKKEYLPYLIVISMMSMASMVIMCMHYGVWRMIGVQVLLGAICGIRGYMVGYERARG